MSEMKKPSESKATEIPPKATEHLEGRSDLLKALLFCILAVVVVRSFFFEPFKIPSSSMVPTLKIGDHIFVSKFNYGLSLPFTKIQLINWGTPKRGDVIVFLFPRDESLHYIKRVMGIPGDTLEFRGRDIFVNGQLVIKSKVEDPAAIERVTGIKDWSGQLFTETVGNAVHYVQYSRTEYTQSPQVETVPADQYFVVGDNRDESYDSRGWGYVPKENIKGRAVIIWLSLDQDQQWGKITKIRWDRFGTMIR